MKDGERLGPDQLNDKLESKRGMAKLIIDLCNLNSGARTFLKRVHEHNFELRGKVVDLATGSLKKATEEMNSIKSDMVQVIRGVKEKLGEGKSAESKTFSGVFGKMKKGFVVQIKRAIKGGSKVKKVGNMISR